MRFGSGGKQARFVSAELAAGLVKSGDWVDYAFTFSQPDLFDKALAARVGELRNVKFRSAMALRPRAALEADLTGERFFWFSWFFGPYERRMHDAGICNHIPNNLGEIPDDYRRFLDPVDVLVLKARPADAEGNFNFSLNNAYMRSVVERARVVIVETCDTFAHAFGTQNSVHASEVDYVIAGENLPMPVLPNAAPGEVERAVARFIGNEIGEGACLQIGIGGMPNAVCALLLESGFRDLGVHTEMLTDGLVELYKAGCVTGARKTLDPRKITYTFALGSKALYDTVERNADFHSYPLDYTNAHVNMMQNDNMVAINNTTVIDLQGQAASESDGHRHISGTGGQGQFVRGAYASKGGKSFICLASTYERKGVRKSRIVLEMVPGTVVSAPRSDMSYVVTEYGIANLRGKSVAERAQAIIGLAHPEFREGLEREAREKGLIPRYWV